MPPTPSELRVRVASASEAEVLAELVARTFRDAYGAGLTPDDLSRHLEAHCSPDELRRQLGVPGAVTLIATIGDQDIGYAQLEPGEVPREVTDPTAIHLTRFYLEQAWIGKGVAQPLMARCRTEAEDRGHATLWLTVWQQAVRPIAFYERCGFRRVGETRFVIGTEVQQDWLMACPLGAEMAGATRYPAI